MKEVARVRDRRIVVVVALAVGVLAGRGFAKDKPKSPPAAAAKGKPPPGTTVNACGCYRNEGGACVCTDRKAKCECPGECEPVGCSEKRDKELEREMAAEIKRAQDDEKRRQAEQSEKETQEAKQNGKATAKESAADDTDDTDADASAPPPTVAEKPAKAPRKDTSPKGDSKSPKK
jgi:hypothetical protein